MERLFYTIFLSVSSFTEYTVVDSAHVTKIDPSVSSNKACLLSCGVSTGVGAAWRTANVEPGSTVAIFGLGSIGFAVAEGSRLCGAKRVIGKDMNPEKFQVGKKFGVTDFINPGDCGNKPVSEDEDEEAVDSRRRMKKKSLPEREEMEMQGMEEEEEEKEEEESEYETEDVMGGVAMLKPVFVVKAGRDTVAERERMEEEERAMEEKVRKKLEERKVETKQILVEEIKKEEVVQKNVDMKAAIADMDTDDDDDDNGAEDYEAWKVREIGRIKRDREAPDAMVKEKEEWERKNTKPTKQKWRFMQRYYHKGAFFQDQGDDRAATAGTDEIYRHDFSAPTGEDMMDKSILPKVMQVKNFGLSGRPKWSHLLNEDTTDWTNPWTFNDALLAKYNAKMAAMSTTIERPKGSKKLLKVC